MDILPFFTYRIKYSCSLTVKIRKRKLFAVYKEEKHCLLSMQVIIAALNEEEGIGPTIAELKEYLAKAQVLVVDGNSIDQTVEVAKNLGAEIVIQDGSWQR